MVPSEIKTKIEQYLADALPPEEMEQLWHTLQNAEEAPVWYQAIEEVLENTALHGLSVEADKAAAFERLKELIEAEPATPVVRDGFVRRWKWMAAAAVLLLLLGGTYWLSYERRQPAGTTAAVHATDIPPGKSGAILTLANGRQVILDSMGNGVVATENGAQVLLKDGALAYDAAKAAGVVTYNTMTTPKGRQFQLLLPDGTKVWLNAASSITYPTSFQGKERQVQITGEAYFDVAARPAMPFRVQIGDLAAIEVLGTQFNVNAYTDEENISTTLLEGSVRVLAAAGSRPAAHPGQVLSLYHQANISRRAPSVIKTGRVSDAVLEQVIAWKNGAFNFNDKTLEEVIRQLVRWYNVDVVYEGKVPDKVFYGEMGRDLTLSECLKVLEKMQVHFRIEDGKRLVVME